MKKKNCIIVSIIIVGLILSGYFSYSNYHKKVFFSQYLRDHPENVSILLKNEQQTLLKWQADKPVELASVAKIIVGIEYARQVHEGKIDCNQMVALSDLNVYRMDKLDGGAQEAWEKEMKNQNKIENDKVALKDIATGMIDFSSNANFEYLIQLLGLDNIQEMLDSLHLKHHEKIFPFFSAIYVPKEVSLKKNIPIDEAIKEFKIMPHEEVADYAIQIHEKLAQDQDDTYRKKLAIDSWYNEDVDNIVSQNMVKASASDYATILEKINNGDLPGEKYLREIMESPMKSKGNQKEYQHLGFKGGSTNSVLNTTMYAEAKDGNKITLVVFIHDISKEEYPQLEKNLPYAIEQLVSNSENYVQKIKSVLES